MKKRSGHRGGKITGLLFALWLLSAWCIPLPLLAGQPQRIARDGLGRRVSLSGPVRRIATNYGIAAHMVFALGAQKNLVAIDEGSRNNAFFNALSPATASLANAGKPMDFSIEQALTLDPDLILVPGRNRRLVEKLAKIGLTVFGVVAEDLAQVRETMINLGRVLGREAEAARFTRYYDEALRQTEKRICDLKTRDRPLVYLAGPLGTLSTCSRDMYQSHLIRACGGRNAGDLAKGKTMGHGWIEIAAEQLIAWDPQVILVVQYSPARPVSILRDRRWRRIRAVEHREVFRFPSRFNPWDYPSPQAVLGLRWLASLLHPERFKDMDILEETEVFFEQFYGKGFQELGGKL